MSFYDLALKYQKIDFDYLFSKNTNKDIINILSKDNIDFSDFIALIKNESLEYLESIAEKVQKITINNFGKTVLMYTPMYIANFCVNRCAYCGFNIDNKIRRTKLTLKEIENEAINISNKGFKHILLLTGEDPKRSSVEYIGEAVKVLRKYFSSIGIEIYPLHTEEYRYLKDLGVDSLTIYQETYDMKIYDRVHLSGPKKDYMFRVNAPERAIEGGINCVNIGALLGLRPFREEVCVMALHGLYLLEKYPWIDLSFSFPRIRPHAGEFNDVCPVYDEELVQAILALRLLFPKAGMTISTREEGSFRDNIIPLGITKMSADSSTEVGGHSKVDEEKGEAQFEISDNRNEIEVMNAIRNKGYNPVFKDWVGYKL